MITSVFRYRLALEQCWCVRNGQALLNAVEQNSSSSLSSVELLGNNIPQDTITAISELVTIKPHPINHTRQNTKTMNRQIDKQVACSRLTLVSAVGK